MPTVHKRQSSSSALRSVYITYTTTSEIYTLSLHDALPISRLCDRAALSAAVEQRRPYHARDRWIPGSVPITRDRKSTRLNSSHTVTSYAVFCLKKKKNYL